MTQKDNHYRIEAKGHATGSQEVCNAVSMLFFTLANFLSETANFSLEEGDAYVEWDDESSTAYDMTCGGFRMLARDYPNYIKII